MAKPLPRRGTRGYLDREALAGRLLVAHPGASLVFDPHPSMPAGVFVVKIRIGDIAAGGAGVGRLPDGRAVFVHRTAPDDLAEIRVTSERTKWARGRLVRVHAPGPDRRPAPCGYYANCGGCTLQHLDYAAQLSSKTVILREALRRIGKLSMQPASAVASPEEFYYRNRVRFHLHRPRADPLAAGFHALERPGRIVDVGPDCMLLEPALAAAWGRLRACWGRGANRLPSGERLQLSLRATALGEVGLTVEGGLGDGRPEELLADTPELGGIWRTDAGGTGTRLLAGSPDLFESWGEEDVRLSGTAFLQVNRGAAMLLEHELLRRAGTVAGLRVLDAYCGVGILSGKLLKRGARVIGIEADRAAVTEACRRTPGAEFIAGRVEDHLEAFLPADLAVLNPPRTGLAEAVSSALKRKTPLRMLYVSCDPATLARDIARLAPEFQPVDISCFDLFPQTSHVETLVELKCVTM